MLNWYYVKDRDRVGPVDEDTLSSLIKSGALNLESYVWRKGFEDWKKLETVEELQHLTLEDDVDDAPPLMDELPPVQKEEVDWNSIQDDDRLFMVKIGRDRGANEVEYGPFSIEQLRKAHSENRINGKSFIFVKGMENWSFLADLPIYERIFSDLPPVIEEDERREHTRKPFVARMLFHDNEKVFEGICRDVSVGGLQVLVADYPAHVGDEVTLNVHPDNGDYSLVAKGVIVRVLDGNQGFSLRFESLNDEAEGSISTYVNNA